jgi:hypothetical protein
MWIGGFGKMIKRIVSDVHCSPLPSTIFHLYAI